MTSLQLGGFFSDSFEATGGNVFLGIRMHLFLCSFVPIAKNKDRCQRILALVAIPISPAESRPELCYAVSTAVCRSPGKVGQTHNQSLSNFISHGRIYYR